MSTVVQTPPVFGMNTEWTSETSKADDGTLRILVNGVERVRVLPDGTVETLLGGVPSLRFRPARAAARLQSSDA